jgi:hypothetical protein
VVFPRLCPGKPTGGIEPPCRTSMGVTPRDVEGGTGQEL